MIKGEERLFITDVSTNDNHFREFFLKYIGTDSTGIKMEGEFPELWMYSNKKLYGPQIFDDDNIYKVVTVDYKNNFIWLTLL